MVRTRWTLAVAACLLAACGLPALAASSSHFTAEVWTPDQGGLPSSAVLAMIQSRDGYLWLGTPKGLARFDGVRFEEFNEANTPGLGRGAVLKLFEDSQGDLWVGTETRVVLVTREGEVTRVNITTNGTLKAVCEDATGAVWLYTDDGQLARYRNKNVQVWEVGGGYRSGNRTLAVENGNLLWVGSSIGLNGIGPLPSTMGNALPVAYEMPVAKLDFLLASRRGGYWRLADGQIQRWETNHPEKPFWPYPWGSSTLVTAACEDQEGDLIVGTYGDGVYWFDAKGGYTRLSGANELSHNTILSLVMDREGCLWVGTDGGGLNRVRRQVFGVLEASKGLTVQSVCNDHHGGLWIGYNDAKIQHWSTNGLEPFSGETASEEMPVRSVFASHDEKVWAGTYGRGLLELQDARFRSVDFPAALRPLISHISAIYQDRHGMIWVGAQHGLARWAKWDSPNWSVRTGPSGAATFDVRALADDVAGNLWIGTEGGGLIRVGPNEITTFTPTNGLPSDSVVSLCVDPEGILWAGTTRGLGRFDGVKWTTYSTREGLTDDSVGYLLPDDEGYLWMGSSTGLMRVPRRALRDFADGLTNFIPVRVYGKADGLPTGECSEGSQPAACQASDGTLWFPTTKGLAFVNPKLLQPNTNPPPVLIESVHVDGTLQNKETLRAPLPHDVTVPAGREGLDIAYTSLNLSAPSKGHFRYRLAPHESRWIERPWDFRTVHYSKVPAGDYRFQVEACNEDGVWSSQPATLAITVLPPFWRTWWFISVAVAFLLGIIVGSVHYVSTQKLQRQLAGLRQQEALEQERARIARDIHDQVGANLTQVSLLGELVESDKEHPAEVEAHARQISQTALETTRALDEIVWTVNPSNDTLDGLVNYVCKYAQEYLALASLKYRLEVPQELPSTPISPELRHNVFLAAKEAINNVVKHSGATSAWLRLRLEPERFSLEIEDNGRGLPEGAANKGRNGLRNMRKRLEDIGGQFSISPGAEGGTRVCLSAPLARPLV